MGLDRRDESCWQPQSSRTRWRAGLIEYQETWSHRPYQAPLPGVLGGTISQHGLRTAFLGGRWAGWGSILLYYLREMWSVIAVTTLPRQCPSFLPLPRLLFQLVPWVGGDTYSYHLGETGSGAKPAGLGISENLGSTSQLWPQTSLEPC